jgi:hypothetical protein
MIGYLCVLPQELLHNIFGWGGTVMTALIGLFSYPLQMRQIKRTGNVDNISASIAIIPLFSAMFWMGYALTFPLWSMDMIIMGTSTLPSLINTWRFAILLKKHNKKLLVDTFFEIKQAFRKIKKK